MFSVCYCSGTACVAFVGVQIGFMYCVKFFVYVSDFTSVVHSVTINQWFDCLQRFFLLLFQELKCQILLESMRDAILDKIF